MPRGKFKVWENTRGVFFSVDHQSFKVDYFPANKGDPEEKFNAPRRKWFVKQLKVALKRLADSGSKKSNGTKGRATKKAKT